MTRDEFIEIVSNASETVLERMSFIEIEKKEPYVVKEFVFENEFVGSLAFDGEYSGLITINCSKNFATEATSSMLGLDDEDIENEQMEDTVKELLNMIIGEILYGIDSEKSVAKLEIPEIFNIREKEFPHKDKEDVFVFPFSYSSMNAENEESFFVEIAINLE